MKRGMVTLSVAEAKRLIAKGVASLPQVQKALAGGSIIIAGGTTNAYVAEELTGQNLDKAKYTAGVIYNGRCCVTPAATRIDPLVLIKGKVHSCKWTDALADMGTGDVFIKGGNAFDCNDYVGILLGSPTGGTIGAAIGSLSARGIELITPIGLEKLIPSVPEAISNLGIGSMDYSRGMQCGMQLIKGATVLSEDKALSLLSHCRVTVAAKGGNGSSIGSTTLTFSGTASEFRHALAVLDSVLGEKALSMTTRDCPCPKPCDFGKPNSSST